MPKADNEPPATLNWPRPKKLPTTMLREAVILVETIEPSSSVNCPSTVHAADFMDALKEQAGKYAMPAMGASTMGNAAGVIQYCVKNNYLSADAAGGIKDKLMGMVTGQKPQQTGYANGAKGLLQGSDGTSLNLKGISGKLKGVENATVTVKEWDGDVIFLHEVRKGAADRSYGVQVARLAGLPQAVIERAKVVLKSLEAGERQKVVIDDLPLFRVAPVAAPKPKASVVEDRLRAVHPDELTAKEALALVYELRELLGL